MEFPDVLGAPQLSWGEQHTQEESVMAHIVYGFFTTGSFATPRTRRSRPTVCTNTTRPAIISSTPIAPPSTPPVPPARAIR